MTDTTAVLADSVRVEELRERIKSLVFGRAGMGFVQNLIMLNLLIYFIRPNDIIPILGTIRLPMIISIISIIALLPRLSGVWPKSMKIMSFFLFVECLRLIVGMYVFDEFVINDFWQFQMIKDLALQFFGLAFPVMLFFQSQRGLQRISKAWWICAFLLPLYAISHQGKGMGGFLGDENDMGLALLFFMSLVLAQFAELRGTGSINKFFRVITITLGVVAIIVTNSRGAFVGMVGLFGYFFLRSRRKFMLSICGLVLIMAVLPFVPKAYYERISSIKDTDSGTAKIRRHYWKLAFKVFADPKNTLWGVGLENVKYHVSEHETGADLQQFPGSAGRAVHSMYFQLLPDLGLWGVSVVGSLVYISFSGNRRNLRLLERSAKKLEDKRRAFAVTLERMTPADAALLRDRELLLVETIGALNYLRPWLIGMNCAFVAIGLTGVFISVLYYPMLWLNFGISTCLALYSKKLFEVTSEVEQLEFR